MGKGISKYEMMEVFNCGIGYVPIADSSIDLSKFPFNCGIIGKLVANTDYKASIPKIIIPKEPRVGIIMGSDSDLPYMKDAANILDTFNIPYELTIVSAHRTPSRMYDYAENAAQRGLQWYYCRCWRSSSSSWNGCIINQLTRYWCSCKIKFSFWK